MKRTNIFLRSMCFMMLLNCVGVSWGQTKLTAGGSLSTGVYQIQETDLTITTPITITSGRTVTIDLNGFVLKGNFSNGGYVLNVEQGGLLIIKDSRSTSEHAGNLDNNGVFIWPAETGKEQMIVRGGIICSQQYAGKDTRGIFIAGKCVIECAKIMGCVTQGYGAAVNVATGGVFEMTNGEISYNRAIQHGGGIYCQGSLDIKNTKIQYNKAIGVENSSNRVSYGCGGGIYVTSEELTDVRCKIENCEISNNYASVFGGGIYSSKVTTEIKDSKIQRNHAMHSEKKDGIQWNSGRGGGFCFIGNGSGTNINFTLDNTKVENNACMYYGGGGHIASGAVLTQKNGSTINSNVSVLHGAGGLHVTSSAHFIFEDGEISKNVAHSVGGGIHSSYDCTLELKGGTISNNTAHHRGGGVHINTGGDLTLNGTNITYNEVLNGVNYKYSEVLFHADGTCSYSAPESDDNTPYPQAGYGGGVLIDAGTCTMNKGNLSYNKAKVGGGGIALVMINTDVTNATALLNLDVVEFTLNGGEIKGNTTEKNGAGVYLMENTMEMPNPLPDGAGVAEKMQELLQGIPHAFINSGTLMDNKATGDGGALFVNGDVTMSAGSFEKNRATNGGGVCIHGGTISIIKGNVTENEATNYGGGIYVENTDPDATITLNGEGVFEKNTAKAGGGMAVNGPFTFNFAGTLQNNRAENGGGIYLLKGTGNSGAAKGATLHFNGGFIRNNTTTGTAVLSGQTAYQKDVDAVTGVGGGIFMADYTTLDFHVTNTLGFYGNRATNAADDIFANGNGTSVTLPSVKDMTLSDFSVPAGELFWAEDYYSRYENSTYESDASYKDGTNRLTSGLDPNHNLRYQFALQNLKREHIIRIEAEEFNASDKEKYVCLALGYHIFYITIKKTGLKEGESAFFHISSDKTNSSIPNPYITMLLTGEKGKETMEKRVALPEGKWRVTENTAWTWTYDPSGETTITKEVKDDKVEFLFANTKQNEETTGLHDEDIRVNEMGNK